jgi:predicted DNA-binding transcriptional regulator AlpA
MTTKKPSRFLTSRQVRERYGGISDMGLWRWLQDHELNFPKPRKVRRRNLWAEDELDVFDASLAAERQVA